MSTALDALWLWELPWLKKGLEKHRMNLPWEERWRVRLTLETLATNKGAGDHGHLYLV